VDLALYDSTYQVENGHWWFAGRRAIVFDQVRAVLNGSASPRSAVLDLGCGTGRNLLELTQFGRAVGLDIEERALLWSRKRQLAELVRSTAEVLPFRDEAFHSVMALDLLEHLDDDVSGVREVWRVLRRGGHFFVFVPAYRWLWGPQDDVSHHRRRYTPPLLRSVLRSGGFAVDRLTHANLLLLPLILGGRLFLRASRTKLDTENRLHPNWSNGMLRRVFASERFMLRHFDLPLGVSLLCVATKR